jgi:hypothetical protein
MGQEFFINSQELQDKISSLLPSQGGAGAGFDLSASTQIIPIIDLTESAEGSNVRQDLQTSFSFKTATPYDVSNATTTVINNTGYWRVIGTSTLYAASGSNLKNNVIINDGTTDKIIWSHEHRATSNNVFSSLNLEFNIFLDSGHSIVLETNAVTAKLVGSIRQIADIDGNLINPQ